MSSTFHPRVSIVIPVYNGSDFLREAIDSALAQTYDNIEIVVVNDGSRDNGATEAIALSYGERIRYIAKPNGGVATALNRGIEAMTGEYFSWLSHDDLYYPHKVARQVQVLAARADREAIVYSDFDLITPDRRLIEKRRVSRIPESGMPFMLLVFWVLHGCALLVPRSAFERVGTFREDLPSTQDYDLWFRMGWEYPFVHIPEILVSGRIHPNQGSRKKAHYAEVEQFYRERLPRIDPGWIKETFPREQWKTIFGQMLVNYAILGYTGCMLRGLALSFQLGGDVGLSTLYRGIRALSLLGKGIAKRKFPPSVVQRLSRSSVP